MTCPRSADFGQWRPKFYPEDLIDQVMEKVVEYQKQFEVEVPDGEEG